MGTLWAHMGTIRCIVLNVIRRCHDKRYTGVILTVNRKEKELTLKIHKKSFEKKAVGHRLVLDQSHICLVRIV